MDQQTITPEQVRTNIAARNDAESIIELIGEDKPVRFWECLRDMANAKVPRKVESKPLEEYTDLDARRFENHRLPRGQYIGQEVGLVPCEYL